MNRFSYWETKYFMPFWDVVIVGSGITGLTASIFYKKRHPEKKIAILEKGALPSGASTRNAGFACFGSVSEILDDLKSMPEKEVFELIEKRYRGLSELRELLGDQGIGYAPTGGFELFRRGKDEMYRECLGSLGYINAELVQYIGKQAFKDAEQEIDQFGFKDVEHMIVNELEGTVDTGKMMKSLIDLAVETGVSIFNGCEVKGYTVSGDKCILDTNIGEIMSARFVVATNGFAKSLIPEADVQPCRGQVLITRPLKNLLPRGCFHHDRGYDYFRTIDDRILLGGGRQLDPEGEQTSEEGLTEAIGNYLESLLKEVILPGREVEIDMRWSGIMGMGSSKSVILKEVEDRVYCAVRLGGMGVALGTSLGRSVAQMLD